TAANYNFIIIASDGLWDVISYATATEMVCDYLYDHFYIEHHQHQQQQNIYGGCDMKMNADSLLPQQQHECHREQEQEQAQIYVEYLLVLPYHYPNHTHLMQLQ